MMKFLTKSATTCQWIGIIAIVVVYIVVGVESASAQSRPDAKEMSLLERLHAARAAENADPSAEEGIVTEVTPIFPFSQPQIGPLIKRSYQDDVERRTAAFVPSSTEAFEGFEFPELDTEDERWIRVDLGQQKVYAYEGDQLVRAFLTSTGVPGTPTVTGEFRIRTKVSQQVMSGGTEGIDYYYLPGVKWVMYFYSEYALHGTYWHNNFGSPMSHGCVNLTNTDAKWLFDFAGPEWDGETVWFHSTEENPGTRVVVHE